MKFLNIIIVLAMFVVLSSCGYETVKNDIIPIREDIEWLNVWIPNSNQHDLPRVLLIGNSITNAYYPKVAEYLEGKAYVGRLTTSKSIGDPALLDEIALVLKSAKFDLIHFNNGLHGWGYTEDEYRNAFPDMIHIIRKNAPGAILIWASSTPMRTPENMEIFDSKTDRVRTRNMIAKELVSNQNIEINDLFSFVENRIEFYAGGDGVHLVSEGVEAIAVEVSEVIGNKLAGKIIN